MLSARLCDEGAGSGALVSPGWWQSTDGLVVAGKTVDAGLDQDEAELAVLVLSVALEMLADRDGLTRIMLVNRLVSTDGNADTPS